MYVDPLLFWKEKQHVYFQLSKVAKAYFGIPVTSALVERFFSKTGFILRPHRRYMQDDLAICRRKYHFFIKGYRKTPFLVPATKSKR